MPPNRMEKWIREALTDADKEGPLTGFALQHMGISTGGNTVEKVIHVTSLKGRTPDPKKLAELFAGKAETHVKEIPGSHQFQIAAFYSEKEEPEAYYPFRQNGLLDMTLGTESPTAEGMRGQDMRIREQMTQGMFLERRELIGAYQKLVDSSIRSNEVLTGQLQATHKDNFEMISVLKELMLESVNTKTAGEMEIAKFNRSTAERQMFLKALPIALNRITGMEIVPQSTQDTAMIDALADNIKPEHLPFIKQIVPEHLQGVLFARLKKRIEETSVEEAHARNRSNEIAQDAEEVANGKSH